MMKLFKPGKNIRTCPICGAPLEYTELDQFDMPVGYRSECTHCENYSDIWVSGLREVSCGNYASPDYTSDYAAMNIGEKLQETVITLILNGHLLLTKIASRWNHHHRISTGRQLTA